MVRRYLFQSMTYAMYTGCYVGGLTCSYRHFHVVVNSGKGAPRLGSIPFVQVFYGVYVSVVYSGIMGAICGLYPVTFPVFCMYTYTQPHRPTL